MMIMEGSKMTQTEYDSVRILFLVRGDASKDLALCNRMGKHAYQAQFDEKYTKENIYARCQLSVGYLAW